LQSEPVGVEVFDEPLILQSLEAGTANWTGVAAYDFDVDFALAHLRLDEWDRIHGWTQTGVPFVLHRAAQEELFAALDEFTDDSITFQGKTYDLPPLLQSTAAVANSEYWNQRYHKQETPWDSGQPSPIFTKLLPGLKIPKSRVLILGAGTGADAQFFANQGHVVTAVDFSSAALALAQKNHPHSSVRWVEKDVLRLPEDWNGQFDLVIEHTCYCAILPSQRNALVKVWQKMLHDQGQLLGTFFTMHASDQPPFGASEWEIRKRMQKSFQFLFWGRWNESLPGREGKELAVFAQRRKAQ